MRIRICGLLGLAVFAGGLSLLCGCRQSTKTPDNAYSDFLATLTDANVIARLDTPQTELNASTDPSNGNNDFNNFAGKEGTNWAVLANLQGPGYVSRFWTTGGQSGNQRFRFYFDGERNPRIDATVNELRRGAPPFIPELSRYEQACWYSYVPMPYRKSLKILAETGNFTHEGWPRLFFQFNSSRLPEARVQGSFPTTCTAQDVAALRKFGEAFIGATNAAGDGAVTRAEQNAVIHPGVTNLLLTIAGPAIIRELAFQVAVADVASYRPAAGLHENFFLTIAWDDQSAPSVAVPLDAFMGKLWHSPDFACALLQTTGEYARCRLPMPFQGSARIALENRGKIPLFVGATAIVESLAAWPESLGFLHAVWHRTGPEDRGRPHPIVNAQGRGKVVGCLLGVSSADPSWWALEGDESIRVDAESVPGWLGTGLEDYFNAAWYYKNNLARPWHGLVLKRPFTTVQYRFHRDDARSFEQRVEMQFERGPDQASPAWLESVGYYYLASPTAATSDAWLGERRAPPADPFDEAALMSTLCNYERFGDYSGALACLDRFRASHDVPYAEILRLREIAYRERIEGFEAARPAYEAFVASASNEIAIAQAKLLLWFHESPRRALLSLNCGNPTRVYIDSTTVGDIGNPQAFMVFPLELTPGSHVLSLQAYRARYPEWVQACIRTHSGLIVTDSETPFAFDPSGNWRALDYDASTWGVAGDTLREGPPPAPHIGTSPHAFVDMQSQAWGIFIGTSWPETGKSAVFRKVFEVK